MDHLFRVASTVVDSFEPKSSGYANDALRCYRSVLAGLSYQPSLEAAALIPVIRTALRYGTCVVTWKQAMSYWETALELPLVKDGVPGFPAYTVPACPLGLNTDPFEVAAAPEAPDGAWLGASAVLGEVKHVTPADEPGCPVARTISVEPSRRQTPMLKDETTYFISALLSKMMFYVVGMGGEKH